MCLDHTAEKLVGWGVLTIQLPQGVARGSSVPPLCPFHSLVGHAVHIDEVVVAAARQLAAVWAVLQLVDRLLAVAHVGDELAEVGTGQHTHAALGGAHCQVGGSGVPRHRAGGLPHIDLALCEPSKQEAEVGGATAGQYMDQYKPDWYMEDMWQPRTPHGPHKVAGHSALPGHRTQTKVSSWSGCLWDPISSPLIHQHTLADSEPAHPETEKGQMCSCLLQPTPTPPGRLIMST